MKVMTIKIKLSIKEYIDEIKPNLKDTINNLKKNHTRKIQLAITVNCISSKYVDEERVIHSESNNTEIMIRRQINLLKNFLNHFLLDIISRWEHQ